MPLGFDEIYWRLPQPVDGRLESLGQGHLPLGEREPLHGAAVREVGGWFVKVVPGDPTDAEDGLPVAGQDDITPGDALGEIEDLDRRLTGLLGAAGIPLPEQ